MIMETEREKQLNKEIDLLREILVQKEHEIKQIKVRNLFLETLFEGINEEIMVVNSNYIIQNVNKVFLKNYGLKREDVLGEKCHRVTYGSDSPCSFGNQVCPLEEARKTGERVEIAHSHKKEGDGVRELIRIMYPVATGGSTPDIFVEISRDLTEQQNLVRKLKASQKKFRAILDTATDAILSIDEEHKIILFNNAAQRIFGYSRSEVLGKDLSILIPLQYGDHRRYVQRFMETRTSKIMGETLSLTALRKGGEEFPVELGLSHHEMQGSVTFTAIIRDVSDQKYLEKKLLQSERLAAVGETVAHVAHEIKNPLMIIGGFSHQIKKSLTDAKAAQKLDMIFDEVIRLEKLVANLGDFTREYTLMKRPADINSVIRDVLIIMGEIYPSEKYLFESNLAPDLGQTSCDPDKMKQVLMNVIANGVQAMEEGGKISITTRKMSDGIEIRIRDNGIGISEEGLDHIFEPFYTTRERGSGLGLSISYKIVEAHNGEISAISMPGEGTTFIIHLPST
jgi:two-component system sensor kinase FixL